MHRFTYDDSGRLVKDENPAGGYTTLARTDTSVGLNKSYTVTATTAMGLTKSVKVERTSKGLTNRVVTGPDNIAAPTNSTETGGSASTSATGMTASYTKTSHPLFGGQRGRAGHTRLP